MKGARGWQPRRWRNSRTSQTLAQRANPRLRHGALRQADDTATTKSHRLANGAILRYLKTKCRSPPRRASLGTLPSFLSAGGMTVVGLERKLLYIRVGWFALHAAHTSLRVT